MGRASWGTFQALFVPVGGGATRQADLAAVSQGEAERELASRSADELAQLLEDSRPRDP